MATSRKLFQQGVAAASKVLGSSDTCYCPICTGGFGESALQTKDLTREHVPPQALGGAAIILTCKECNNSAGHTLDAAAARRRAQLKFAEALAGDSVGYAGRAMAKIAGEQIRVDVHKEASGTIGIKFVGGLNDPASVERTKDYFHNLSESGGGLGEEFTLTAHARYHDRFAKLSDLRTAFLACTALLGYKFAFHPSTRQIREQILNPNENLLPRWWTYPASGWSHTKSTFLRATEFFSSLAKERQWSCPSRQVVLGVSKNSFDLGIPLSQFDSQQNASAGPHHS
jgi:hypothetical protein